MRFARLSLERYGRFENCELSFRGGEPDLHIIYGANEAGKTTSLAAVSDLLFGFPQRSPYNFMFDYSLLRVGAVLEEDGQSLSCRRKRGMSGTLVDAQDSQIDEGLLLALLRGQSRETFALSFSLNQEGLRAGGRAMVDARDDAGRALFAAGSGLTRVSEELSRLEQEADAIWGPRAAQRRSFTQAQRELVEGTRASRDQALRPKTWLDARDAVESAAASLKALEDRQASLIAEVGRAERIRRIAPFARVRAEHLAALVEHTNTVEIPPQKEEVALAAIAEAEAALRAKTTAEQLVQEVTERMEALASDPAILLHGGRIDGLVTSAGASDKALRDMARLKSERDVAAALAARLREEIGSAAVTPPSRIVVSKLRELALAHVQDAALLGQITESAEELAQRRKALPPGVAQVADAEGRVALAAAVDAARALGADVDERCASLRRKAEAAVELRNQALGRLAPWLGDAQTLISLPRLARVEIDDVRTRLADLAGEVARQEQAAIRARDEADKLAMEMEHLASGAAIPAEEIAVARSQREQRWQPLRDHVLSEAPLVSPAGAVAEFEAALAHADERSDLRFSAAEESSRLAVTGQRRMALLLEAEQADAHAQTARARASELRLAWGERLTSVGLPDLEPSPFIGWTSEREAAEAAHEHAVQTGIEADAAAERRNAVRVALAAALPSHEDGSANRDIAPLLALAEQVRKAGDDAEQRAALDQAALAQLTLDEEALARRRTRAEGSIAAGAEQWAALVGGAGLVLDIADASAVLDLFDELRSAVATETDRDGRIEGIARDISEHARSVDELAKELGVAGGDPAEQLSTLRRRLVDARSAHKALEALQESRNSREEEVSSAKAAIKGTLSSLQPVMEETGSPDLDHLGAAIERSRAARALRAAVATAEAQMLSNGDGFGVDELVRVLDGVDLDELGAQVERLSRELAEMNTEVSAAAAAHGDAKRAFANLDSDGTQAVDALAAVESARAELGVLAEHYILKRAQAVTLRWAIEQYRERHQDPLLLRASTLFSMLTVGRYVALRVDTDGPSPRLLGLRDDGRTVVEVGAMSEGTTDQLFLALRLAAVEQSISAGVRLPFLADDLFVNFDDERSEAGFRVLAELARSTQVLFFTHHPHLAAIAREVVGADLHSECSLS